MASFTKRGRAWRVQVKHKGRRITKTFRTKQAALAWAVERESNPVDPHSLNFAVDRYSREVSPTKRGKRWEQLRLRFFQKSAKFIDKPISEVTSDELGQYRDQRLAKVAASSVNREFNLLHSVFETARREWKWLAHNPLKDVRRPPEPQPRDTLISKGQQEAILEALGFDGRRVLTKQHRVAVAFLLALETAMRAGEIVGLRWTDENLKRRFVTLPITKNGTSRNVPLSKKAVRLLKLIPGGLGVDSASLDALFRRARDKAAPGIVFHDTRHASITRWARKIPIQDLARMTGHKDLNQLQAYYNAHASDIAKLLD